MSATYEPRVPEAVVALAADWHGGQGSELYAIASTGGITFNEGWVGFPFLTLTEKYDRQSERWHRLVRELDDPIGAGELDDRVQDDCAAIAQGLEDLAVLMSTIERSDA